MNLQKAAAHFERLREIAAKEGVQIFVLASRGIDWKGLYVFDADLGPGIALNKELPISWLAWTLAHELGHYFATQNLQLFSPFSVAIAAALSPRAGGYCRSKKDKNEHWADQWAARTLIREDEFIALENEFVLNLPEIAGRLGLPTEAVFAWEIGRRDLTKDAAPIRINTDRKTVVAVWEKSRGTGGHQSLLRRVVPRKTARQLTLSFNDFSLARIRLLTVRGGWREPYSQILKAAVPTVRQAGGVAECFRIPSLPAGAAVPPQLA